MKRCSYCGAEYADDAVMCPMDETPLQPGNPEIHSTPGQRRFFAALAVVFLLAVLTSVLIAFLTPNSFRSTARITVDRNAPDPHPEVSPQILPPDYLETESKMIKSHAVLAKAVDALNLCEVWGRKYNRGTPLSSGRAESILRRSIDLDMVQNTKLIEVHAFSRDPGEAARLANGVVGAYRDYRGYRTNNDFGPGLRAVTVIDPAEAELYPSRPNRRLIIVLGVMIGIVFGLIAGTVSVRMGSYCFFPSAAAFAKR